MSRSAVPGVLFFVYAELSTFDRFPAKRQSVADIEIRTPCGPPEAPWESVALGERSTKSGAGPSDAALVLAARAGERWAQEALFRRYARLANGLAHRLLANDGEADDLVQDSFVLAFEGLGRLAEPQAFAAWLSSIVVRTANKRLRRRRLLERLGLRRGAAIDLDAVASSVAPPDVAAEIRTLYALVERMPVEERMVLVLRRVEGLTIQQIADRLGRSTATVKRRLERAQGRLSRATGAGRGKR